MRRFLKWVIAGGVIATGVGAAPASAQVRVGIHTPNVGVSVSVGSPRVYVVERYRAPYYRPVPVYRPLPIGGRPYDRDRYDRDRAKREREYRKDVRDARKEYARDIREARRDYERDIREARRDRRR